MNKLIKHEGDIMKILLCLMTFLNVAFANPEMIQKIDNIVQKGLELAKNNDRQGIGNLISSHIDYETLVPRLVKKSFNGVSHEDSLELTNKLKLIFPKKIEKIYSTESKMRIFAKFKFVKSIFSRSDKNGTWIKTEFENSDGEKAYIDWLVSSKDPILVSKIKIEGIDMEPTIVDEWKQRFKDAKRNPNEFLTQYAK